MSFYFPDFASHRAAIHPTLICIDESQGYRDTMWFSSGVTRILECLRGSCEDEVAAKRSRGAKGRFLHQYPRKTNA